MGIAPVNIHNTETMFLFCATPKIEPIFVDL